MDWITQCKGTQNRADCPALMCATKVKGFHSGNVFELASSSHHPAFNPSAEVTVEKVLKVNTAAPRMIRFEIAIIPPFVSCENVRAPQADVKLVICVPL